MGTEAPASSKLTDLLIKLGVPLIIALCGYTLHFVVDTDYRLAVLEWRVNERFGPPDWQPKP